MMRDHKFSRKSETRKNNHNKADNVDYAGSILADIQNMQVQQENGTIFLPRFRHVFQVIMGVQDPRSVGRLAVQQSSTAGLSVITHKTTHNL